MITFKFMSFAFNHHRSSGRHTTILLLATIINFIIFLVSPVSLVGAAQTVGATSVSVSDSYSGNLLYQATEQDEKNNFFPGLADVHATIHYHVSVADVNTGENVVVGSNVPVGTVLKFSQYEGDISWVGTGKTTDTPTGTWVPSADLSIPTNTVVEQGVTVTLGECRAKNYVGKVRHSQAPVEYDVYIPFLVKTPTTTINVTGTASLTALGADQYRVDSSGTIEVELNFAETYGRYYYQWVQDPASSFLPGACFTSADGVPMLDSSLVTSFPQFVWPGYEWLVFSGSKVINTDPTPYIYNAEFAAQTINYNLVAIGAPPPSNAAPSDPVVTGPATVQIGEPYNATVVSADSDGDDLYYEIDWDYDAIADQRLPSANFVSEGSDQTITRTWATAGIKAFKVRAVDELGNKSNWGTTSVDVLTDPATLNFAAAVNGGPFTASDQNITDTDTLAFSWSSTNVTSCTGTNFNTGGATSNSNLSVPTPSPGITQTYTLDCTATDGTTLSRTLNVTVASVPPPVVTVESRVDGGTWAVSDRIIDPGQTVDMRWSSSNAVSCTRINAPTVSGIADTVSLSIPAPGTSDTYGVICFNSMRVVDSVDFEVTVNLPLAATATLNGTGCTDIAIGDNTCTGSVTWSDGDNVYNATRNDVAYTGTNGTNEPITLQRGANTIELRDSSAATLQTVSLSASCDALNSEWSTSQAVCAPLPPTVDVTLRVDGVPQATVPTITPTQTVEVEWDSTPTASECRWVNDYGGAFPILGGDPDGTVTIDPSTLTLGATTTFAVECRREVSGVTSRWGQDSVAGAMAEPTLILNLGQDIVRRGDTAEVTWGVSDVTGIGFTLACELRLPGRAPVIGNFTADTTQTVSTGDVLNASNVTLSCTETSYGQDFTETTKIEVVPSMQEI